jgi:hypothetical protein
VSSIGVEAQEFLTNFSTAKFLGSHKIETRRDLQIFIILAAEGRSLPSATKIEECSGCSSPFLP